MTYQISTITMSLNIPETNLNLINIGKYLKIDKNILGVKFFFGKMSILKGKYDTSIYKKCKVKDSTKINKRLFYNQISMILLLPDLNEKVNLKLFNNGSIHLTGVKNENNGKLILNFLYDKLLTLLNKTDTILLVKDENNIYLDSNNNIYTESEPHVIIGYKYSKKIDKQNNPVILYNIDKKNYIINRKDNQIFFISCIFQTKKTKELLDLNGKYMGYTKIELLKNHKKLYKSPNIKFDYNSGLIFYENKISSYIIGNIVYYFAEPSTALVKDSQLWKIISYSCNPFNPFINKVSKNNLNLNSVVVDINTINIYFKISFELNRTRLFTELLKHKYLCEYKPEKYTGVKLRFKINSNYKLSDNKGVCLCNIKCTCTTITFLIFQSGNVIISGFKNRKDIDDIYNYFMKFINDDKVKNIIMKKTLI